MCILWLFTSQSANVSTALRELHDHICELQTKHLEAGDFNQAKLTDILPCFHQHISLATRESNTLDHEYTNRQEAYIAVPHHHMGFSDQFSILLVPAHRPVLKDIKPTQTTITVWHSGAASMLQDCFE